MARRTGLSAAPSRGRGGGDTRKRSLTGRRRPPYQGGSLRPLDRRWTVQLASPRKPSRTQPRRGGQRSQPTWSDGVAAPRGSRQLVAQHPPQQLPRRRVRQFVTEVDDARHLGRAQLPPDPVLQLGLRHHRTTGAARPRRPPPRPTRCRGCRSRRPRPRPRVP